ncbi:MAG: phosphotransferase [Desulfobacteraceae bacterium]|nr:phosphotransferase [Desulfobacteraceae bacterium]
MTRHRLRTNIQHLRTDALTVVRSYIEKKVLPDFGATGSFNLDAPAFGKKSLVYYFNLPKFPPMVLRADPLRHKMARRIVGHEILFRLGLPAPEVMYRDLRFRTRIHWGHYFMAERRLEGVPFWEHSNPKRMITRLGEIFASLHGYTAKDTGYRGSIRLHRRSNPIQFRKKAKEWLARYRAADCPDAEQVRAWLDHWPKDAWKMTPRLCMGDIAPSNILIHGEKIHLVDLSSVKFSSALLETVRIRNKVLHDQEELWELFFKGYMGAAEPDLRQEVEQYLTLMEGLLRIRLAGKTLKPAQRAYHCHRLFEIIQVKS